MWTCPNCGRAFQRNQQAHYCGEAPKTVAEYIALQPPEARPHLLAMQEAIRTAVPNAAESIAWSMPAYQNGDQSISFAACKNHVSLYAGADAIAAFAEELGKYQTNKSAVYFPYGKALPRPLIGALARWRLQ